MDKDYKKQFDDNLNNPANKILIDRQKIIWAIILGVICWFALQNLLFPNFIDFKTYLIFLPSLFTLAFTVYLSLYNFKLRNIIFITVITIATGFYFYFFQYDANSQSLKNIYLHMPIFLWAMIALVYCDIDLKNYQKQLEFMLFFAEVVIWTVLLLLCISILTRISYLLFGFSENSKFAFYFRILLGIAAFILPFGAVAIAKRYSNNKSASLLARLLAQLALLSILVFWLFNFILNYTNFSYDSKALLFINLALIMAMALIIFINAKPDEQRIHVTLNIIAILVCIIGDIIALSAIINRLQLFGLSPNKITILGLNTILLINLVLQLYTFLKVYIKKANINIVATTIAKYLPIYVIWSLVVMILLPIVFKYK